MSRELFNQTAKSSLLRDLCRAKMRETRQIAAFSVQAGRHPMHKAAIAPVGASLLASFSTKPRRARETRLVQRKHAADPSPHRPDRKAPHAGGCNCTCRSELVSRAFQRDREELASTGSGDKLAQFETVPRMPVCQFRPRIFGHVDQYRFTARRTTTIQVKTIIPHHHHL